MKRNLLCKKCKIKYDNRSKKTNDIMFLMVNGIICMGGGIILLAISNIGYALILIAGVILYIIGIHKNKNYYEKKVL